MTSDEPQQPDVSRWINEGRGTAPATGWTFGTDGALSGLELARESGDVVAADDTGGLYRLDRRGQFAAVTRLRHPIRGVACSDDGQFVAAIVGECELHRFDSHLQELWKVELPEPCLAVAMDPFGQYMAVSLTNGVCLVYAAEKYRVAGFETIRPLSFLRFVVTEPVILGAADHGLLGCYSLTGSPIWEEKLWSNIGGLSATGDGELIFVPSFAHGLQTFDGDGHNIGSYVLEGTINHVSTGYDSGRLIVSTVERHLCWLDADGELVWEAQAPEDISHLTCDPLGEWIVCGFASGRVMRLDWGRK